MTTAMMMRDVTMMSERQRVPAVQVYRQQHSGGQRVLTMGASLCLV
jgi:hypothetical protein